MAIQKKSQSRPKTTGCAMLVPGYGILRLHATSVTFGIFMAARESQSRHRKAMYVDAKTSGSFTLGLAFYTYAEKELFSRVLLHYGNNISRGIVGSPCRVMIPSVIDSKTGRSLDRVGIPETGIPFGDNVADVARRVEVKFLGTSDPYNPVGIRDTGLVSNVIGAEYLGAIKKDPQAAYYYPSGSQLSGKGYGVDTLYDSLPGPVPHDETVLPPPPRSTRGGVQEF